MLYTYDDLLLLLKRAHGHLEKLTDRHGASMEECIVLVDCENALKAVKAEPKKVLKSIAQGSSHVH